MKSENGRDTARKIAQLVEEARRGGRLGFQELVNMFQEDIYRLAYYRTFSRLDAEDLTQDVFEQVYRKIDTLQDPQRFRAWLYTIAVNRCNDFLRKRRYLALLHRDAEQELDTMESGKESGHNYNDRIEKKRFWQQVKAMLQKLSATERQVFTLRFMDHRNIKEIANILGKNESTIKTHLYRALNKVRGNAEFFKDYRESLS